MGVSPLMSSSPDRTLDYIAAGGLLVGAVFGLAGTFVASPTLQASLWAIDSVALVVATSLLALRYFRAGVDILAAGFLVFAIGEGVLLSGTAAGPTASVPAFAAGTALWASALAPSVHRGTYHGGCVRWAVSAQACSPSRPDASTRVRRCCPPRRRSHSSPIRFS